MNNFTNKKLILEGIAEALPLWIKASVKPFPDLKVMDIEENEWLISKNGKPFIAVHTDGKEALLQVVSKKSYPELIKMQKKGIKKIDDVRKFLIKALELVK